MPTVYSNHLIVNFFRHAAQDTFGILESKHAAIGNMTTFFSVLLSFIRYPLSSNAYSRDLLVLFHSDS